MQKDFLSLAIGAWRTCIVPMTSRVIVDCIDPTRDVRVGKYPVVEDYLACVRFCAVATAITSLESSCGQAHPT